MSRIKPNSYLLWWGLLALVSPTLRAEPARNMTLHILETFPNTHAVVYPLSMLTVKFNEALDPSTVNEANVQLSRQETNGAFTPVATSAAFNPNNNSLVVIPTGSQLVGAYTLALYSDREPRAGIRSVTGAALSTTQYLYFTIQNKLNLTDGLCPVTGIAPGPDRNSLGDAPYRNGTGACQFPMIELEGSRSEVSLFVIDQRWPLNRDTVNDANVTLSPMSSDFSRVLGPAVAAHAVYYAESPSVQVAITQALKAGYYRLRLANLVTTLGMTYALPFTVDFHLASDQKVREAKEEDWFTLAWSFPMGPVTTDDTTLCKQSNPKATVGTNPNVSFGFTQPASNVSDRTVRLLRYSDMGTPLGQNTEVVYNRDRAIVNLLPRDGYLPGDFLVAINGLVDPYNRQLSNCWLRYHLTGKLENGDSAELPSGTKAEPMPTAAPYALLMNLNRPEGFVGASINRQTVHVTSAAGETIAGAVAYNPSLGHLAFIPSTTLSPGCYSMTLTGLVDRLLIPQAKPVTKLFPFNTPHHCD
jgi:hypothetical protein